MQENVKRFAIYARTATKQELEPNFAMAEQVHQCKECGIRKGYQLVEDQVYEEVASGASADRPMLLAVLKDAEEGKFDTLIIRDYARLARKPALLQDLIRRFAEMSISVESTSEQNGVVAIAAAVFETVERIEKEHFISRMQAGKRAKRNGAQSANGSSRDTIPDEAFVARQVFNQTIEE